MENPGRRFQAQFLCCHLISIMFIFGELSSLFSQARASDTSTSSGSTICFYYPIYPNTSVVNQTTCQYQCCTDTAKSLDDTCCQSGSKWWISLIVVFGFLYICAVVVIYGCCRYCSGSKRRRSKYPTSDDYAYPSSEESQTQRSPSYVIPTARADGSGERANRSTVEFRTNRSSVAANRPATTPPQNNPPNISPQIRQQSLNNNTADNTHFDDHLPKYDDLTKRASFMSKSNMLLVGETTLNSSSLAVSEDDERKTPVASTTNNTTRTREGRNSSDPILLDVKKL